MTKLLRRPSHVSARFGLSFGLGLLAVLGATSSWAAPPDDGEEDAAADTEVEAPAEDVAPPDAEPEPEPPAPALTELTEEERPAPDTLSEPEPEPSASKPVSNIGDKHSIQYTSLLAPRANPLGLEERLWIGYQYRLYNKDKAILNGSNLGIFFRPILSPAIALVGATLQFQPAAVFRLRATYSYVAYFGTFQYFQSFQSPH
ncbi:MAG TPA: hypothetical protein VK034_27985, partial [Enhygromyxa sp.]|nr:hypothetical protein [Enhygromyxa sp.]